MLSTHISDFHFTESFDEAKAQESIWTPYRFCCDILSILYLQRFVYQNIKYHSNSIFIPITFKNAVKFKFSVKKFIVLFQTRKSQIKSITYFLKTYCCNQLFAYQIWYSFCTLILILTINILLRRKIPQNLIQKTLCLILIIYLSSISLLDWSVISTKILQQFFFYQ